MRYTIITPTLLRPSLARLCDSIDAQTDTDWEHLVAVDTLAHDASLLARVEHPNRRIVFSAHPTGDWASACAARRSMWPLAHGDYLLYIDDDNYLADNEVLATLRFATKPVVLWGLLFHGVHASPLPIRVGRSDTNQFMVRRDVGRWPERSARDGDGVLIERLTGEHEYEVFEERALVVYPQERAGK